MAYMKDSTGRRLDDMAVRSAAQHAVPIDLAVLGDSLANYGEGAWAYAEVLSNQRVRFSDPDGGGRRVYSYPGQAAATVLANVGNVTNLATKPDACLVQAGTNDVIGSVPMATTLANIEATCQALEEAGIAPVMCTLPPLGGSFAHTALRGPARVLSAAIRLSAKRNRRLLLDVQTPFIDAQTQSYLAAYDSGDNVHPSTGGLKAWGQLIANLFAAVGTVDYSVLERVSDATNTMMGGANFLTGGGTFGGATSAGLGFFLGATSAVTGHTPSLVAEGTIANLNWQRVTVAGASASQTIFQATPATVAPGDLIRAAVRFRIGQDLSGSNKFQVYMRTYTASGSVERGNFHLIGSGGLSRSITDAVALTHFTVPALADRAQLVIVVPPINGTYDLAQPTLQNLTALGID